MKKIEMIEKAGTIKDALNLLSKRQLRRFGAVISFFQLHNNWNYFLDERESSRFFVEYFIGSKLKEYSIVEQRNIIYDYLEMYAKDDQRQKIIEVAKAVSKGMTAYEINKIAKL